jgi:hypothetical protein
MISRIPSSGMLRCVVLVRTGVSDERSASIIRLTRIGELGITSAVTSNRRTLRSSDTPVLTRATRRHIPEEGILQTHRRENLKSYIALTGCALYRKRNMSPVRYELGFYIPEDGILQSHGRENLKSYIHKICSGTTEIARWIWEHDTSGNDRLWPHGKFLFTGAIKI